MKAALTATSNLRAKDGLRALLDDVPRDESDFFLVSTHAADVIEHPVNVNPSILRPGKFMFFL